ncbi:hypothetical protein HDU76_010685 [Blyttiomyces sp. JEL0837]|nr:hypothetical protein HDU76_010685 [Blyttiomyces sp. JEL0837]
MSHGASAVKDSKDAMEKGVDVAGNNVDAATTTEHGTKAQHGVAVGVGVGIGIASISGAIGLAITVASVAITTIATTIPGVMSPLGGFPPTTANLETYFDNANVNSGTTTTSGSPSSTINTIQKNCLCSSKCLDASAKVLDFTASQTETAATDKCLTDLNTNTDYYSQCRKVVGMGTHLLGTGSIPSSQLNGDYCNKDSWGCIATAVIFELQCENYPDIQGFANDCCGLIF